MSVKLIYVKSTFSHPFIAGSGAVVAVLGTLVQNEKYYIHYSIICIPKLTYDSYIISMFFVFKSYMLVRIRSLNNY